MESRPGPNGGFTVNDDIVSRDILGSMQCNIQFVSRERGRKLHARAAAQEDASAGLLLREIGKDRGKQGLAVFFGYAEADFGFGIRRSHGNDRLIQDFNDLACDRQQLFAACREGNAASMPIKQLLRHDFFELLHLKADGGLRPKQARRAATDAAGLGDSQEAAQQVAIKLGKQDIVLAHIGYLFYSFLQWKRAP